MTDSTPLTALLREALDALDDVLLVHDRDLRIIAANKRAIDTLELAELPASVPDRFSFLGSGAGGSRGSSAAARCLEADKSVALELPSVAFGGVVEVRASPLRDEQGRCTGVIQMVRDVTEARRQRDELELQLKERTVELEQALTDVQRLMLTDPVSGALNRRWLLETLPDEVERATRYERPLSLMMLAIDGYAEIDHAHGAMITDQLLTRVTGTARTVLRTTDAIIRWSSDRFVVLSPETKLEDARAVAGRLCEAVGQRCVWSEHQIEATIGVGVVQMKHGDTPDELIERADAALHQAHDHRAHDGDPPAIASPAD